MCEREFYVLENEEKNIGTVLLNTALVVIEYCLAGQI